MPDLRLIRADILKLRRRRGLMIATAVLTLGVVGLFYAIAGVLHIANPAKFDAVGGRDAFDGAMALLTLSAAVAGTIVGATAGGSDIESGVFRDLAATGRSRTALFASRVPGAWAIVVPALLAAIAISTLLGLALNGSVTLTAGAILAGGASALVAGMLLSAASVGLAALSGSRGMVIGVVLAFQLGLSPILAQIGAIGAVRYAIPSVANARIAGELQTELALGVAIVIVLAWAAVTLGAGLWRTRTQEI